MNLDSFFGECSAELIEQIKQYDQIFRESGNLPTKEWDLKLKKEMQTECDLIEFRLKRDLGIEKFAQIKSIIVQRIDEELLELVMRVHNKEEITPQDNLFLFNLINKVYNLINEFAESGGPYSTYEYDSPESDALIVGYRLLVSKTNWSCEAKISDLLWSIIEFHEPDES